MPHCGANWCAKYGKQNQRQKYRCNECQHYFIPDAPRHNYPEQTKQHAVDMYCEGTSINAISRIQGVKHGTIYSWLKKKAQWAVDIVTKRVDALKTHPVSDISLDEMWTYLRVRRGPDRDSVWIWTAVVEKPEGSPAVLFDVGDRSEATFLRLVAQLPLAETYHSDGYEVYSWLPRTQHETGKYGRVNRNEGIHSILRDRLARLKRRTKAYTKNLAMLRNSLALVFLRLGWI